LFKLPWILLFKFKRECVWTSVVALRQHHLQVFTLIVRLAFCTAMSQTSDVAFRVRLDFFATLQDSLHPPEYALRDHIQHKLHHLASLVLQESTAVQLGLHLQAVIVYQDRTLPEERRLLPARLVLLELISRWLVKAAALGALRACTATPRG
jgi:hypothetical protein